MSKFKVGDRVRVLPGGSDGDHGGIGTPMPFDTTVMHAPSRWSTDYQVVNPDKPDDVYGWYVPEEFLVPLPPEYIIRSDDDGGMSVVRGDAEPFLLPPDIVSAIDEHFDPKPWLYAEEGEVWVLVYDGDYNTVPAIYMHGRFVVRNRFNPTGDVPSCEEDHHSCGAADTLATGGIKSGYRIYPPANEEVGE